MVYEASRNDSKIYDHGKEETATAAAENRNSETSRAETNPFSWRHNASLPRSLFAGWLAEFITLKTGRPIPPSKSCQFLKWKFIFGHLVSNVVTFVFFDMETLFYDEVSNRCLMLGMCLTPSARTHQTRCDNKHMNHDPKWKMFVLECDKAGTSFCWDFEFFFEVRNLKLCFLESVQFIPCFCSARSICKLEKIKIKSK